VLGTEPVVDSAVGPLQDCPDTFDAVCAGFAFDVLSCTVVHGHMGVFGHPFVGSVFVGAKDGTWGDGFTNGGPYLCMSCAWEWMRYYPSASLSESNYRCLSCKLALEPFG